jgi:cysteine dioxygenase
MPLTITELLAELDRHPERVPLRELVRRMTDVSIALDDVAEWLVFSDECYRRNLMHAGPGYQALILCWRSGQRSPIHDHPGSSCGVRVLQGTLTEVFFRRGASGTIVAAGSHELAEGTVTGSQDQDIHQISNLQPDGGDLVTLHIYSPPLLVMNTYSLTDTTVTSFRDPVHEFAHGAGI